MSISKLCDYFEDIGLINLSSINLFLEMYTQLQKNNKAIFPNYLLRAKYALLNYIKHISTNKDLLLEYCEQTIQKYSAWSIMKQYFSLSKMIVIFRYKEKQKTLNAFLKMKYSGMIRKEKGMIEVKENPNIVIMDESIGQEKKEIPAILKKYKPMIRNMNQSRNKKNNNHTRTSEYRNNNYTSKNNSNSKSKSKNDSLNNNVINYNHTTSSLFNHSSLSMSLKHHHHNHNHNHHMHNHNSNYPNYLRKSPKQETKKNIESYHSTSNWTYQQPSSQSHSHSLENFYSAQQRYIDNRQGKILSLKLNNLRKIESECTFQPQTNHSKSHSKTFDSPSSSIPRYIKLNHDAIHHKEKLTQLMIKQQKEEMNQRVKGNSEYCHTATDLPSDQYYHKLYQDAHEYQLRKKMKMKNHYAEMMHHPRYINNNIPIKTTFEERNQKSIEKKKKKINVSKEKKENVRTGSNPRDKNKGLVLHENSRRAVERLYERHRDNSKGKKEALKMPTQCKDLKELKTKMKSKERNEGKEKIKNDNVNEKEKENIIDESATKNNISSDSYYLLEKIKAEHVINYKISQQDLPTETLTIHNPTTINHDEISLTTIDNLPFTPPIIINNPNTNTTTHDKPPSSNTNSIESLSFTSKALQSLLSQNPPISSNP